MCDYSLHAVASRPAEVGDKLISTEFKNTATRGFSALDEPNVAVCLLPGTELAFDADVYYKHCGWLQSLFARNGKWNIGQKVGKFCQINLKNPHTHHDAIEFPNGQIVLLTSLRAGQRVTVLQLPISGKLSSSLTLPEGAKLPEIQSNGALMRTRGRELRGLPLS